MIKAARVAATAFSHTTPGISLFHAIIFWWACCGLIDVLINLLISSTTSSIS
jgi:hypothetical protein